jgi:hypothetical protein
VKAKYVGDGSEFLNGVPARDLTDEDWNRLTEEQQDAVINSRIYARAEVEPKGKGKK